MHAFPSSHAVVVGAAAVTQHPAEHVLITQSPGGDGQSLSFTHTLGEHPPELDALDVELLDVLDVELLDVLDVELLDVLDDVLDVELLDVDDAVEELDAVAPAVPPAPPALVAPPVPKRTESVPQAGMAQSAQSQNRMIKITWRMG